MRWCEFRLSRESLTARRQGFVTWLGVCPEEVPPADLVRHAGVQHKLTKDTFTRLVESIVDEWIRTGMKDIPDFKKKFGMPLEAVVREVDGE